MEQGNANWAETTTKSKGNLGNTGPITASGQKRDLALFNLAIDSKLRGSDLIKIKVSDLSSSGVISSRAMVMQQKTGRPVQFEITATTRDAITDWMTHSGLSGSDFLFPSRVTASPHITTRQYSRIVTNYFGPVR